MKWNNIYLCTLLFMVFVVLMFPGISAAFPVQWKVSNGGNGHFYEIIKKPSGINWIDARSEAIAKGGYLATILSAAENQFIFENLVNNDYFWETPGYPWNNQNIGPWIGAFQIQGAIEPDGGWTWVNSDGLLVSTYSNWSDGEPNNYGSVNENAALFYDNDLDDGPIRTSMWADWPNSNETISYVVEYDSNPDDEAEDFPWEMFYPAIIKKSIDKDKDGFTKKQGDCNDSDSSINPNATEICGDGIDQDCDGSDLSCNAVDNDGDGYTENQGDCNDGNTAVHPGAAEVCGDGIDQDCDGYDLPCLPCTNIAGSWNGSETVTITCCLGGVCETDTFSGTDTITIQQNGCNISYEVYLSGYGNYPRTGTINANEIQLSGLFAVLQPWCSATQNTINITGTVNGDQINLQGSGIIKGTCDGASLSCTGSSTATLTRSSTSTLNKTMTNKESIKEFYTPLLNSGIKIISIMGH